MKNSKKIMAASFLIAAGYAGLASAHNQTGALGSATTGAARTDVYQVTCSNDGSGAPARLFLQVQDLAPVLAPLISIQASKGGISSPVSTDPKDGDGVFSPGVTVTPAVGAGVYVLTVNKSGSATGVKGVELYNAQFHCQTAAGIHTGTSWVMTQNQ